ncbi:MAG: hypothetical protein Q7K34_02335 [archaeon]|nr:hypothetical protein [archaeon]
MEVTKKFTTNISAMTPIEINQLSTEIASEITTLSLGNMPVVLTYEYNNGEVIQAFVSGTALHSNPLNLNNNWVMVGYNDSPATYSKDSDIIKRYDLRDRYGNDRIGVDGRNPSHAIPHSHLGNIKKELTGIPIANLEETIKIFSVELLTEIKQRKNNNKDAP